MTLQDGNLLIVTGKTFGITNVIALDAAHNVIQDQRIMVERDDRKIVNLHKGSTRFTYACTPNCEPTLTIGGATMIARVGMSGFARRCCPTRWCSRMPPMRIQLMTPDPNRARARLE